MPRCRTPLPLILGFVLLVGPLRAAEEEQPADSPVRRAASLAPLAAQRPECLLGPLALWPAAEPEPEPPPPPIFLEDRVRGQVVAVQVVAAANPSLAAAYLRAGSQQGLWLAKPARDPHIDKALLKGIDHRRKVQGAKENYDEASAYKFLVLHAKEVSPQALAKIARHDVFYVNLWEEPDRYVGEPVHITGRLKRLIRLDAPRLLWKDGIKTLYEAWVFPDDKNGTNPYCIVFSELPKNVKMGENVTYQIACDAYFFKLFRYETRERGKTGQLARRDAPLFIGRGFVRSDASSDAAEGDSGWSISAVTHVLPGCVGVVVMLIGAMLALGWWFKRGDRAVHSRIAEARGTAFLPPPEDDPTGLTADPSRLGRFGGD